MKLSEHLKPKTRAYHEIWLDGEKLVGPPEEEPILGPIYLPRKFKTGIVVPPHNDVDVFSQDLGFIAILDNEDLEEGTLLGFNLTVGGGLGATHGEPQTFPRLADVIGFLTPDQMLKVAETVVMIQRDFGDRTDRKHARLKYTIADRGVDWFKAELFKRLGFALEPPRAFEFNTQGDRFGWLRGHDGRWHLTLAHRVGPRGGPARCPASHRPRKDRRASTRAISGSRRTRTSSSPTCAQAELHEDRPARRRPRARQGAVHHAAAPRRAGLRVAAHLRRWPWPRPSAICPTFVDRVEELLVKQDLKEMPLTLRITGCPNGCARPYLAEIALIGRAPGRYTLRLGGDATGQRLNVIYRDNIDEPAILTVLDELFAPLSRRASRRASASATSCGA